MPQPHGPSERGRRHPQGAQTFVADVVGHTPGDLRHEHALGGQPGRASHHNRANVACCGTSQQRRKCYGWAEWFLVSALLQFLGGYLDMTADRSAPPRT